MTKEKFFKRLVEYNKIANIDEIGRRYFAMNSFDGILTIMGVLLGSYVAAINNAKFIISTGIGTSIAIGISGMWGTYLTEVAERKKKLNELSKHTLRKLHSTKIAKAEQAASLIVAFIDGVSPFVASLLVISPFFFSSLIPISIAYVISFALAFLFLMGLGAFLGYMSQENIFIGGLKMVFAGICCTIIILILGAA